MAYAIVSNPSAEYAVDWETVERLCRSSWLAYHTLLDASAESMSDSKWYNPLSWSLPTITTVNVNWEKVRLRTDVDTTKEMAELRVLGRRDMRSVAYLMMSRIAETARNKESFRYMMSDAQTASSKAINGAVDSYEGLLDAAKFTRDASADIVLLGATVLSGGAAAPALAALTAGSGLKGYAKYQDTESMSLGMVHFAGSFGFGVFKIGPALGLGKLSKADEYVLILVQGVFEGGASYAAGKGVKESLTNASTKIVGDSAAKLFFGTDTAKKIFERIPIPVTLNYTARIQDGVRKTEIVDGANALLAKGVEKASANAGASKLKSLVNGGGVQSPGPTSPRRSGIASEALVYDEVLLKFAIVHMTLGVGHGW